MGYCPKLAAPGRHEAAALACGQNRRCENLAGNFLTGASGKGFAVASGFLWRVRIIRHYIGRRVLAVNRVGAAGAFHQLLIQLLGVPGAQVS